MGAVVAVAFAIACFVGARKNQSRPAAWLGAALVFVALVLAIVALRTYF
jgi:cellobiose-specific phosphotransferase system component IIC